MSESDPLLDGLLGLVRHLREHGTDAVERTHVEQVLTHGYALALKLEGRRRRLERRERLLRELLSLLREQLDSCHEPAAQRLHRGLQAAVDAELLEDVGDVVLDGVRADEQLGRDRRVLVPGDDQP
jgi:vacuolar-type H+-ATPase subunit E/Vma4